MGLAFLKMDGGGILCYDFSALEDHYAQDQIGQTLSD